MIKIRIPATSANLGAGFDALGLAVSCYNYVGMQEYDGVKILSKDKHNIPLDKNNLIYKTAKQVYDICGVRFRGLMIEQESNIPMTRGLGSSSACVIAGLVGANTLLGSPLSHDDLVNLSAKIEGHPDNTAPCLLGGIVTAVFDNGKVHWVKQEVCGHLDFIAIIPDYTVKTETARAHLPEQVSHKDAVFNLSRAALFSASILTGKYENLQVATEDRLHQNFRLKLMPNVKEVMHVAEELGAYASYISGAGPTIMSIVDAKKTDFTTELRKILDQQGLEKWQLLRMNIDNRGTTLLK